MAAKRQNVHPLENLCAISNNILVELLENKLTISNSCLQTFLQIKRHTLYHLFQEEECCTCSGNRRNNKKLMCSEQWHFLYSSSNKSPCGKHTNCSCQYDAIANVRSSQLDISLCSLLLLNSGLLAITKWVKQHIYTIRKIRNRLAHNAPGSSIDEHSFQGFRKDLTVAIIQLARACSLQLAVQTEEKIKLAKTPQETYRQICDACPQCTALLELENESLKINTTVSAFQETIERMNECFTTIQPQRVSPDITGIRGRLLNDVYKNYIISYMDANLVIEVLKNKGFISTSYAEYLFELDEMYRRSEQILERILSKDNRFIKAFMDSLVETKQTVIHDFINGNDPRSKLCLILDCDILPPHPVGVNVFLNITLTNRPDLQSRILDILRRESEAEEINKLTMMFSKMSLDDTKEGSIIMRLKPESPDSVERFYNAFLDGRLQELIEEIFNRTGVLDELIEDQVTVVVNISIGGINREPETFHELNWKFLVDELSPRSVAAFLWERGVLNINDIKEIFQKENATRFSQSNSLVHKLNLKSDDTIDDVRQCLFLTSQCYVLRELKDFIATKQKSHVEKKLSTDKVTSLTGKEIVGNTEASTHIEKRAMTSIKDYSIGVGSSDTESENRCFSQWHGENVVLSEDMKTAKWNHVYSGGILFSEKPISETTLGIHVRLSGSGHVHIGFIEKDPSSLMDVRSAYDNGDIKTVNVFRFHKRPCSIDVKMQRNKFILTHENRPYTLKTRGVCVWIAIYIKLGDATVTLDSNDGLRFHKSFGDNIQHIANMTNPSAKLRDESPNAVCLLPLPPGEKCQLEFHINPILNENRGAPRRYHASLGISNFNLMDPNCQSTDHTDDSQRHAHICKFEHARKQDGCQGTLTVTIQPREKLSYEHSSNKDAKGTMNISDYQSLFLVFHLYRVSIMIRITDDYFVHEDARNKAEDGGTTGGKSREPAENYEESYDEFIEIMNSVENIEDYATGDNVNPSGLNEILDKTDSLYQSFHSRDRPKQGQNVYQSLSKREDKPEHVYSTHDLYRKLQSIDRLKTDVDNIEIRRRLDKIYGILKNYERKFDSALAQNDPYVQIRRQSSEDIRTSMQDHLVDLITNLVPFPFCDYLLQDNMITQEQHHELLSLKDRATTHDVNRKLMSILWRSSLYLDIKKIQKALENTGQELLYCFFDDTQ